METRKSTTAGVLFWTPAPVRTSPTSSAMSEDEWEDEDEERAEKDDDFVGQMDENGIIGLSEALEEEDMEATSDAHVEYNPDMYPGPLLPEEVDLSGEERDTTSQELSYNLSHTHSPGEDAHVLSPCDLIGSLTAQTVDEAVRQRKEEHGNRCLPERNKHLDMTEKGKNGEEAKRTNDRKRNKHSSTSRECGAMNGLTETYISKEWSEKVSSAPSCSAHLSAGVSSHQCPVSQPASPVTAPTFPLLLHFTAEELAASPGIEAETFPEMSFIESQISSLRSSPRYHEIKPSVQPAAMFSEEVMSNHHSRVIKGAVKSDKHHQQTLTRKTRQHSPKATTSSSDTALRTPRARSSAAEGDESRKGPLSYRTPDFSKVEPRVRIPKGGYKPPKSKRSFNRESLSPEPPLVFKSPADIVKEVLLNITDGSPASSDSCRPTASAPDFTVPPEFRCRQHATTLLEQLQEDYNTLLTKYAEAENTIDRLRLEAKVNLYSDPPKPAHSVQSGLNQGSSKVMMLDFPQAQRAETSSASLHAEGHNTPQRSSPGCPPTRSPGLHVGQQPAKILCSQADKFLQQLQTFEDLLQCKKLGPFEQMKGLTQLAEGLDSLERGYLLARDEHKLLLQRGAEISHFDPERELERLIYQCGLRMDDLKEQVEQMQQEEPTCETPPTPPPQPTLSSVPSERGQTHPQCPPEPLLVDPGKAAVVEVSSASEESDEGTEDDDTLYLKPLHSKHTHLKEDFAPLTDHYQSFKELPKLLNHNQRDAAPLAAASRTDMQAGVQERETQSEGAGNLEVQQSLPRRKSEHQDSPPAHTSKQRTSRSSPPSRRSSSQSTTLPVHPPGSRRRLEVGKSHSSSLSSLGDITALERRKSKLQTGSSRVLSQDRIISPETDSGFVGSEGSRLTLAAAPSPLHQRASESVLVLKEVNPGTPQTGSAPSPASSPSHSRSAAEPSGGSRLNPNPPRRSRQGQRRRTFSISPQRWVSQAERSRADSELGPQSDSTHTVSEDGQNDRYTESINSPHSSSQSPSPTTRRHHGDSLRALSSSQVANRKDAILTLQAEVTKLQERLKSCLINKKPQRSVRAAPSAQRNHTHRNASTPRARPGEQWRDISRGRRDRQTVDEADEVDESTLRRTARKRQPSAHRQKPQPDMLSASEPSTAQPQPLVSRCTQTPAAAPDSCFSFSKSVGSRTHSRQHSGVSVQVCETADEPDSRGRQAPLCPQCLSRLQGRPEVPVGGIREPSCSSHCHHCPFYGYPDPNRSTEPDCHRVSDAPTRTSRQPAESPDGAARSRNLTAAPPPALLHCMPVCPPPLLLYPSPLYVSPSKSTGTSSEVRGRREARTRRSLSVDKQRSLDSSLNRAIRAARHMKHTSGHMARSLAAGLHYQELLSQSCSY